MTPEAMYRVKTESENRFVEGEVEIAWRRGGLIMVAARRNPHMTIEQAEKLVDAINNVIAYTKNRSNDQ